MKPCPVSIKRLWRSFWKKALEQPGHVGVESRDCVKEMLDYVYQHLEPFKLLVCKAQGTGYESFIHNMVEIEVEATQRFMDVLRRQGREIRGRGPRYAL